MKPSEILTAAIERLHKGWCIGALARNSAGQCVRSNSDNAVAWCACGSLIQDSSALVPMMILNAAMPHTGNDIGHWNDQQTSVEPVIALFEKLREEFAAKGE